MLWIDRMKFEQEGRENIPESGPFLIVSNHFGGNDAECIMKTFSDKKLHVAVAKNIHWNNFYGFALKALGMIPVNESLSNLSKEEKEEAVNNQAGAGKKAYRKIVDDENKNGPAKNTEFVQSAVAVLSKGEAVSVFPEGLWLNPDNKLNPREKPEMKKAYRGIELVIRQYKKLTGKDLPVLPVAFIEDRKTGAKKVKIGEALKAGENETELSDTDWFMAHVAKMLPEEQRGYYGESAKEDI
jgi:1-acyl-sn-glycerol-3-phosphate acyltransferase